MSDVRAVFRAGAFLGLVWLASPLVAAQNPQLQQHVAEIKQAAARNKQSLALYTWQEQQTISIKGEVKKQELFQVQMGPDGRPQKTQLSQDQPESAESSGGRRHGRVRERVVEKKTEEFQDYARQIGALAQQYAHPDPQALQQAFQAGNITLGPAGAPNEVRLVIQSLVKPSDSVTLVFDRSQKSITSVDVSSYLESPSDAVTLGAQFSRLPDGTSHVSSMTVNGVSKHLTVQVWNSNYRKM